MVVVNFFQSMKQNVGVRDATLSKLHDVANSSKRLTDPEDPIRALRGTLWGSDALIE